MRASFWTGEGLSHISLKCANRNDYYHHPKGKYLLREISLPVASNVHGLMKFSTKAETQLSVVCCRHVGFDNILNGKLEYR